MIDLKALRENPDLFRNSQKVRGEDPSVVDQLLKADDERRVAISEFESLRAERIDLLLIVGSIFSQQKSLRILKMLVHTSHMCLSQKLVI